MKRVFVSELSIFKTLKRKKTNKYYNEIICGIQERGGEIFSINLSNATYGNENELFIVVYEDNNNNDEIEKFLDTFTS
ncbi:hypothetical protein GSF08_04130 [Clostridiaceae bacterium DONG20-135]|uniref:Uncharacterized protein n=1 Tax=Copranaerobaculum intestinale TaxID=2692629 RepID=A0A6N8U5F8_9FIRM|nr:hypothetical protein [Copranaerobaculum intestinale]MXQ73121.1 hypothetical protein [Copranaerobaculum intestinale]